MQAEDKLALLPLRQWVKPSGDAVLPFARRGLLDWLSRPEKFLIASYGEGGQILAAGEADLADAQALLRQAYGPLISFGEPTVHSYVDPATGALMVPTMFLRIAVARACAPALMQGLKDRGARLQEVEALGEQVVLRSEVRLADLIGFAQELQQLAGDAAQALCWLLRYEPAEAPAASPHRPARWQLDPAAAG